jgi:hypothetical protein
LSVVVVVIGAAAHRNHFSDSKGSEWYTNKVVELLTQCGYDIVQQLSALGDFVYMANARYFLRSGGGYRGQASTCVERLGETSSWWCWFRHRKVER